MNYKEGGCLFHDAFAEVCDNEKAFDDTRSASVLSGKDQM
jgi:hypothetical protein